MLRCEANQKPAKAKEKNNILRPVSTFPNNFWPVMLHGATPAETFFCYPVARDFQLKVSMCNSGFTHPPSKLLQQILSTKKFNDTAVMLIQGDYFSCEWLHLKLMEEKCDAEHYQGQWKRSTWQVQYSVIENSVRRIWKWIKLSMANKGATVQKLSKAMILDFVSAVQYMDSFHISFHRCTETVVWKRKWPAPESRTWALKTLFNCRRNVLDPGDDMLYYLDFDVGCRRQPTS